MALNAKAIDLRTLSALVAVAEAGSFRAAAKTLGYTQSAISHQIASLEQRLGINLFDRPGGRAQVRLTALGELAYQHAQQVLAATRALDADIAAALVGEGGQVRVGISQTSCSVLVTPLEQLRRYAPSIKVSMINAPTAAVLAQLLERGEIDLGVYVNIEADERLATIPLFDDPWMIIARHDDPIARSSPVSLDVLDGVDLIAWNQHWRAQERLEHLWLQRRITPRIVYRTDDSLMIQTLVATGFGCACLGALSVQELIDPRLRRVAIRDDVPSRTLALCYARERQPAPAAAALMDAVKNAPAPTYLRAPSGR